MKLSKLILILLLLMVLPIGAVAFDPETQVPEGPYEAIEIDELEAHQTWLGLLSGFPDLYEFTLSEPTTLYTQLAQDLQEAPSDFQLLIVRQNDDNGGVSEIARQSESVDDWNQSLPFTLGLTTISMPTLVAELSAGTYRVEVSAPDNLGEYMLYIGTEPESPRIFVSIADLWTVHNHFDVSPLRILISVYFLIPLLLALTLYTLIKRRRQTSHA
jgi:hypothetical protein